MAKAANPVAPVKENALPAHLQSRKQERFGNTDSSDIIIPRVKLLQAISPELDAFDDAKKGNFWHNIASINMGPELIGIPILLQKSYVLWAPRGDDRGILARSDDAIHWDQPAGMEFEVQPKGSPGKVKYILGETIHTKGPKGEPALSEFGSSIPGNMKSPPAAALTYRFLWYFPDWSNLSPGVILNTRSSVRPGKELINKIDYRGVDSFGQRFKIGTVQEQGDEGPFFNYTYTADGFASKEEYDTCEELYNRFKGVSWRAADEGVDVDSKGGDDAPKAKGNVSNKF